MSNKIYFLDRFAEDVAAGQVIGSATNEGYVRGGFDVEGVMSVDHNALRIQPLTCPEWGRAGIAYGPFKRENGLAFGIHFLNGHNTSQTGSLEQSLPKRLLRWAAGSRSENAALHMLKMALRGDKSRQINKLRKWVSIVRQFSRDDFIPLDENFAGGWFSVQKPNDPTEDGNAFVIHATGPENGELWATVGKNPLRIVRGLQNVPIYFVIILRERGAAYYAASLPGAYGLGSFPQMRPLAIDPFNDSQELYAVASQSVLGQIGFWVDTRIYRTQVARLDEYNQWYGTAQSADQLQGQGTLDGTRTETGEHWQVINGQINRTLEGACSEGEESIAILEMPSPPGLLHVLIEGAGSGATGLIWRWKNESNYWQIMLTSTGCRLFCCYEGVMDEVMTDSNHMLQKGRQHSLQIVENGENFSVHLDGNLLFNQWLTDERLAEMCGAGIAFWGAGSRLSAFEAHPRELSITDTLDFDAPWHPQTRVEPEITDDFSGNAAELAGKLTTVGNRTWRRIMGNGRMNLTGQGSLRVEATAFEPNPDRTAYTVPWNEPGFADVRVCITPPGEKRGDWHRGRGGIIFWQDNQNYIIVNTWLDDGYNGASISSFFYLNGFEDLYDAVWTNVGNRVAWGKPFNLRISFDGIRYLVHLNDEPILYRAITDVYQDCPALLINQVGLVANWEWGQDTGTSFANFQVFGGFPA